MEKRITPEGQLEFQNLYTCQKIIRDWNNNPEWSSYDMIPILFRALHMGKRYSPKAKNAPKLADVLRNTDALIEGYPNKVLPSGEDVYMLTSKFTTELDKLLKQKPKTLEQVVRDAAFSYFVFCRIHPLPDGNGRIGRMIAKVIFKRGNLKDPVFHDQRWYGGDRSEHLEAIEKVDETNNLSFMEEFFARSLVDMYDPIYEFPKHRALSRLISQKAKEGKELKSASLQDIWSEFPNLPKYELQK